MTVISVYSLSGGVDKTTTAVHLSYQALGEEFRTLFGISIPGEQTRLYFWIKPGIKGGGNLAPKGSGVRER